MIINTELENKGNLFPGKINSFSQDVDKIYFKTENGVIKVIIQIDKESLKTSIFDIHGKVICKDDWGFHWEQSYEYGGNIVKMSKSAPQGECYYGLGDKPMHLNLKGKRIENWATDQYAFGKDQDPLYKSVPFYLGMYEERAYGIFFDNTFKTFFDFCHERRNVTSFWAHGGEMNYYFFYGPDMQEVITKYTDLTGKPELPPLWALGYHQCKWSYYPEAKVKEVTSKFRELRIPCDGIYLDIDYMDGFRCFTWNKDYFPDPKRMVAELAEDGFKTIVIIDPGIKIDDDYWVYNEAMENDYFCKRADGPYMRGKVWPGECFFPDFTNPKVRTWWAGLFKELIDEIGVKGVWNDMNEPAVMEVPGKTFPNDVRHNYDGNHCSHRKAHNIYGTQMARATYEGVKKYAYPKRPFIITRSAYSGAQRFTSSWTGDNIATWEHLWIANIQAQRMSMSGMSFTGSDIGGFAEHPTGELYARWIQLGVFHPFCRTHSSGDHGNQEPWTFGEEVIDVTRKYVELRYQLLPYLYTMFWEYAEFGIPMLKPLVLFDQHDPQTHYRTDEFVFGNQILVCPIQEPNAKGRRMYIPRGHWYNYWTREYVTGGLEKWVDADLDIIPIFIKEGAIIPKYPIQQYVGEKTIDELKLEVYFKLGEKEVSKVYEDAQDGYDYTKGRYSLRTFTFTGKENEVIIQQHKDGTFVTEYETMEFEIIGLPFEIKEVEIDNVDIDLKKVLNPEKPNTLIIPKNFTEIHIEG